VRCQIPELFFENFDYQSIRLDFLPGILTSDLTNQTLHVHFAGQGYAARVSDTLSYDAVSRDVLSRWTYPMVPDGNLPGGTEGEERYELREGGVYVTRSTKLSRTCHIGPNTLIGPRSIISDAVTLSTSVIGRNVSIHPSCTIVDSYIWDDAVIEAGCTISASIIGKGVRVGKGSTIGKGCLIGDGVRVGEGVKLEDFSRVGRRKWREEDDEDESSEEEDEEEEDQGGSRSFLSSRDYLLSPRQLPELTSFRYLCSLSHSLPRQR
jgi:translation initiation factor eIF-2B subunit epsilon